MFSQQQQAPAVQYLLGPDSERTSWLVDYRRQTDGRRHFLNRKRFWARTRVKTTWPSSTNHVAKVAVTSSSSA